MTDRFPLKKISTDAVPAALERAKHYRLLNEPATAESICRDILAVAPDHQDCLVVLVLSMTDQFARHGGSRRVEDARSQIALLTNEYQRKYYAGLVSERVARGTLLRGGMAISFAYDGFREAMDRYAEAEKIRPPGNDDAILRWNCCARTIERERLRPRAPDGHEQPLE